MKSIICACSLLSLFFHSSSFAGPLHLLPEPAKVEIISGTFKVPKVLIIEEPNLKQDPIKQDQQASENLSTAHFLGDLLEKSLHLKFKIQNAALPSKTPRPSAQIKFIWQDPSPDLVLSSGHANENYDIDIDDSQIRILASSEAGFFYGAVTVWQIFTSDLKWSGTIPKLHIHDSPRFAWRGMMLDSARHFQSVAFIKSLLTVMAVHKLNVLHWHLTDDQGWRIEIKKYPLLTQLGAFRYPASAQAPKPPIYGGFYSQDEIRDIVKFAAEKHITIVPEIEMPGHASAAIRAYPQLGLAELKEVPNSWGVFTNLYNPFNPTLTFLEDVLDEVMVLFPSPFIHVGGDEAVKDQWQKSNEVQILKNQLHLKDDDALQSWFIQQMANYLAKHGRRLVGWDEILQGGLASGATVMSWHGSDGAVEAAKQGHDAIIAACPNLYFDYRQGDSAFEPPGRGDLVPLRQIYDFKIIPDSISQAESQHILGLQGQVWTEHIRTEAQVEVMAFPRELAIAELAWTPQTDLSWSRFLDDLPSEQRRFKSLHFKMSKTAFEVRTTEVYDSTTQNLQVTLSNQTQFGQIHYTLDGSTPTANSTMYNSPLQLKIPSQLKARTFSAEGQDVSALFSKSYNDRSILTRKSQELKTCSTNELMNIEDDAPLSGQRAVFLLDIRNPCWMETAVDLSQISQVQATVGRIPYNFMMTAGDYDKLHFPEPQTASGELEVHLDSCQGPKLATLPLKPALSQAALTELAAVEIPKTTGQHDLCFIFAQKTYDPLWVLDQVSLIKSRF
jgi:hexosaminidase